MLIFPYFFEDISLNMKVFGFVALDQLRRIWLTTFADLEIGGVPRACARFGNGEAVSYMTPPQNPY